MKSDSQLRRDVEAELAADPEIRATAIDVTAREGAVTLSGHVPTYADKTAAERALRRVAGVREIDVHLDVKLAPRHRYSDADIAAAARTSLQWNSQLGGKVVAEVNSGWITLRGEVDWDFQRLGAEAALQALKGVKGIYNRILLKPRVVPADARWRIGDSIKRQMADDAERMRVRVDGATVKLSGTVHSWHEREKAQHVAWSMPGVSSIIDQLQID